MLRRIAEEKVTIKENGKEFRVTKWEAFNRTLIARALKGDAKASLLVLNLLAQCEEKIEQKQTRVTVRFIDPKGRPMKELNDRFNRGKG